MTRRNFELGLKEDYYEWFDDFHSYTAGDWTITTTEDGTGSATEAVSNAAGGVLLLTNAAGDDDLDFLQYTKETFKFVTGKVFRFQARFKVSDATQSDLVMGLQITDTTPLAVSDGVYFRKNDADTGLDFVVCKGSTETVVEDVATVADDTWLLAEFYYDGSGSDIDIIIDGSTVGAAALTNAPDDEELTISFGVQNGEVAAKTMSVDFIHAMAGR